MLAVGLTGGMGSGKSTVAGLLVERGAVLIDADRIAREVVAPGGAAFDALVERFGRVIVAADGSLDRAALAAVAFVDADSIAALNAITHPAISIVMLERRDAEMHTVHLAGRDIPQRRAVHRELLALAAVVVVDTPVDLALDRLVGQRGFSRQDAEARMAAQPSREERREGADYVIDNSSDLDHLVAQVDRVWEELLARRD